MATFAASLKPLAAAPVAAPKRAAGKAAPAAARRSVKAKAGASLDGFGDNLFIGKVAEPYLLKHGLSAGVLDTPAWTTKYADQVASAVLDWSIDSGASNFCHWFQPMASSGVRHGQSGQVQNSFISFAADGSPSWKFKGSELLKGETDGSSYPNGGMRATHTAGGYLAIDPESPIFLRGDTIFIPACFVSYNGAALDEKTPLHRAVQAMSKQGARLFSLMGVKTEGMVNNIGLEQEIFMVPRDQYFRRPDLQLTGRTVIGKDAARGQEMCDHYMAPPSEATPVLDCMREIQTECYKMGIPLKTRHREVAPNQYEFAPLFGPVVTQVDQNLMVMQIIEETATKHGLAALLQEKPFAGINGSGKHNNWSISTKEGTQLLNPGDLNSLSPDLFPVVMAALVYGIDTHGDLMRLAIASPGNDFRLGAMEAPPAVISTFLGYDMTSYLTTFMEGGSASYTPNTKIVDFGVDAINPISVPAEDRNRTSPFPYGGSRFEFRAVGSSQNVSLVNTCLNTLTAEGFKVIADRIEGGEKPLDIARDLLKKHFRCVFNGNGYDPAWPTEAVEKGIWRIDSGVQAIGEMSSEKNVALFSSMGVFTAEECAARQAVLLEHYTGTVEMEALCLIDMINQHVVPSIKAAGTGGEKKIAKQTEVLEKAIEGIHGAADEFAAASLARTLRLETMINIRTMCDDAEAMVPPELWTLATYKELLFLDTHLTASDIV